MKDFTFGKYKGCSVDSIIETQPSYVMWAVANISFFKLSDIQKKRLPERYEEWKFYHSNENLRHENTYSKDFNDWERYAWGGVLGAGYELIT